MSAHRCRTRAVLLGAMLSALAAMPVHASVSVTLTAPANGASYSSPANITLTATATAGQGYAVSKVEFFHGGTNLIGTDTTSPYSFSWSGAPAGAYAITAVATAAKNNNPNQTATSASASVTVNTALYFIHTDQLDTPRLITNGAGQAVWKWASDDPFGANVPNENPSGLGTFTYNLRFPGQYFDSETGKHYNYYRDYDSSLGRYLQSDPIGLLGGLNTYAYAAANPVAAIDPYGLQMVIPTPSPAPGAGTGTPASSSIARGINDAINKLICPPDCFDQQFEIKNTANDIRKRYFRMLSDPKDLYNQAYCEPTLGQKIGTWLGHGDTIEQKKNRLRKLIKQADNSGCPVDPQDRLLLDLEPPQCPAAR